MTEEFSSFHFFLDTPEDRMSVALVLAYSNFKNIFLKHSQKYADECPSRPYCVVEHSDSLI